MREKPLTHSIGFTLLEVMVALAIAAVGLGAVARSMGQSIDVADKLSNKMLATWVASNQLSKLHIERKYLSGGGENDSATMGGREWSIQTEYTPTDNNELSRVDVTVYPEGGDRNQPAARLFGFVSQPN
ncbi:MAG: general secretion pathway protein I [Saprospiraceae bacterium]|jgi:general secretion pathway protein I